MHIEAILIILMSIFSLITVFGFPGPLAVALAALFYSIESGFNPISVTFVLVFILLGLFGLVIDNIFALIGAKKFGASRFGILGAFLGLFTIFIIGPFGLFIGPPLFAFAFECIFNKKPVDLAIKAAVGVVVGALTGIIAKILLAIIMTVWFAMLVL